ncbi:SDR family NAD(P)-dependent oxidoreductase [Pirellulaceae bacterium SH467]
MTAYFAIDYTIHFDDTMAYGGHHFLTAFKLQCASREAFLFGELIFDQAGVKEALDEVHLLTSDAYARNLQSMHLGDRVVILLSLEEWGRASARFCYRVLNQRGEPVCAGFQTLICADAESGEPRMLPNALNDAMNRLREIEECRSNDSFRNILLAGGQGLNELFSEHEREIAVGFLSDRYPRPAIIRTPQRDDGTHDSPVKKDVLSVSESISPPANTAGSSVALNTTSRVASPKTPSSSEAWVFAGQGSFDEKLFCQRLRLHQQLDGYQADDLTDSERIAGEYFGENARDLFSAEPARVRTAMESKPGLSQVAILLQNVLGARLLRHRDDGPALLMGHSFGEIAACQLAGWFDLPTAVRIVCLRDQAIARFAPAHCGMLAVSAQRHDVCAETIGAFPKVCIAGRNHDTQTIVSGPLEQLDRLRDRLEQLGIQTTRIQTPTSFHHPDLREAARHWYKSIAQCSLQAPSRKVYSPIGRRFINQGDDLAGTLASQLLRPFDIQGALFDVASMGISKVVDCGSTGSLANLLRKGCPDGVNVICAASLNQKIEAASLKNKLDSRPKQLAEESNTTAVTLASPRTASPATSNAQTVLKLPAVSTAEPPRTRPQTAIVGRGCILPAGVVSPEQLFESVVQQRVGLIDQRTKDPYWTEDFYSETLVPDRSTSHLSGQVNDSDMECPSGVDPKFFHSLTRTQRLFCIALNPCLPGLRDARRIVCLIGATADGFEDQDEATSLVFAGIDPLSLEVDRLMNSARSGYRTPHQAIQHVLDHMIKMGVQLILVDAACASSLYTTAMGMKFLETDRADAVIVGGIFCPGPGNSCLFSQFRGTTSTGCRPFDANADGVVFSEGSAILTLRRATDASNLGLEPDAIISGAGLSSDGRSSSANVPQSHGQILSLQRCYHGYEIDPATIAGIEGHGTSTPVGDSTEIETLRQFFSQHASSPIQLHSLKGSLGHAGWAAGTASIIAASEYLRRQTFPAQGFFHHPSTALENAKNVLAVKRSPTLLRADQRRIAVDGFGFGGANAHLVIERADRQSFAAGSTSAESSKPAQPVLRDQDIVLIALHEIEPTIHSQYGARFDRAAIKLPRDFIVLPELADDMDISQILTVLLVHEIINNLSGYSANLRNETSVVLAMNGKTERGVEATTRVLSERLKRRLASDERFVESIEQAYKGSRPSKAYTLQCMMPNVASGRAALLHNLRGANFVVDAGDQSLEAALTAASLLLCDNDSGTRIAIVASLSACTEADPHHLGHRKGDEYAVAFALTTKETAEQFGWKPLMELHQVFQQLKNPSIDDRNGADAASQLRTLVSQIRGGQSNAIDSDHTQVVAPQTDASKTDSCPIHSPIWVERPYSEHAVCSPRSSPERLPAAIFLLGDDADLTLQLQSAALQRFSRTRFILIGGDASRADSQFSNRDVHRVETLDKTEQFLDLVQSFSADVIIAVEQPRTSDFREVLKDVARENTPHEALFLAARQEVERLHSGKVELWGLIVDGWSGEAHPSSGAIAGLLKSIGREIPHARMATICTRGLSVEQSLDGLLNERTRGEPEMEVVLDLDRRLVRRLTPVQYVEPLKPAVFLDSQSVVIASAGARGVTAVMLEAIVRDFGCTVIALGRSPLETGPTNNMDEAIEKEFYRRYMIDHPQASPITMRREFESTRAKWEAASNIEYLRSIGGKIEYHIVDVTNAEQVSGLISDIANRYGRVDLLIHGAGVQISKKLQHRTLSEFRKTYQVKVRGLHLLVDSCFEHFQKRVHVHALTSAYSVFGNDGQHDYGAANETMDRLCAASRQSSGHCWTSLAWLAWDGIGMTRASEYRALAKQRKLSGIDPALGQRHFRAVLSGRTGVAINVPMSPAEHIQYSVPTVPISGDGLSGKWIEFPVDLRRVDCLPFHKVRDYPTLPGAWILHYFVEAASKHYLESIRLEEACFRHVKFHRFVRFQHGNSPNLRVMARRIGESIDLWMIADLIHASGQLLSKDVCCASAKLVFRSSSPSIRTLYDPGCNTQTASLDDPYCSINSTVTLSGPFRCLREISMGLESRRAIFDQTNADRWPMTTPALALDAAWRVGAMYTNNSKSTLFVPVYIEEVILPFGSVDTHTRSTDWTIVSTRPHVESDGARWSRTEVCDENGLVMILVKNAFAKSID